MLATVIALGALHGSTGEQATLAPRLQLLASGVLRLEVGSPVDELRTIGYTLSVRAATRVRVRGSARDRLDPVATAPTDEVPGTAFGDVMTIVANADGGLRDRWMHGANGCRCWVGRADEVRFGIGAWEIAHFWTAAATLNLNLNLNGVALGG